jgi:hypothetical protein
MEWNYTLLHFFLLNINVRMINITFCLISLLIQIHLQSPKTSQPTGDQDAVLEKILFLLSNTIFALDRFID